MLSFIAWVLYPMWLAAGAADYVTHRRTDISHTAGAPELLLHVAQFATVAVVFSAAVMLEATGKMTAVAESARADDLVDRLLLLSFAVFAGTPVIEELIRTLRARPNPTRPHHAPVRVS